MIADLPCVRSVGIHSIAAIYAGWQDGMSTQWERTTKAQKCKEGNTDFIPASAMPAAPFQCAMLLHWGNSLQA